MAKQEKQNNWLKAKETIEKHKFQTCRVFTLKFDKDKLSKSKLNYLNQLFYETKLVYNHILSLPDVFKFDSKINRVNALDKNKNKVTKDLTVISSQIKQGIHKRIINSIITLSRLKKSKKKVGKLKFKSKIDSIPLPQFNNTYKIRGKYLKIQKCKMKFKLLGLDQIPKDAEFANANLVRKNEDFYLKVTTFTPKIEQKTFTSEIVGIDAGCSNTLTLSNGIKYNIKFPVTKRTKFLQNKLKNKKKHSSNYLKHLIKINKSIDKNLNKKKDKTNKVISEITKTYKYICIQKENIKGWMSSNHGKSVSSTSIGGIMSALKQKAHTLIEVDRFFPSTQICISCGNKQKLDLWQRVYTCPVCNLTIDRDVNSAINIMLEGQKQLPMEHRDVKPVELMTSAISFHNNSKLLTVKQEALLSYK